MERRVHPNGVVSTGELKFVSHGDASAHVCVCACTRAHACVDFFSLCIMQRFPPLIYMMFIVAVSRHKEFLFSMPFVTRFEYIKFVSG